VPIKLPRSGDSGRGGSGVVSICIPTFNGAPWIGEALASALAQDYEDLEIIVCDDGSSDDTVAIARSSGDPRVRVQANQVRVGMARNWNRSVRASGGEYVKFLMQDDRLGPTCVRRMLAVMEADPRVGLVFSPRDVLFEDPDDPSSSTWKRRFGQLHAPLEPLGRVNRGRALFERMRHKSFAYNWIGEPTAVMVRRDALVRVGLFNVRLRQLTDLEMWLRVAFFHEVGFVPDPLVTFRVHQGSASVANARTGTAWLDRVWLLEGLRAHPEIRSALGPRTEALIWFYLLRSSGRRLLAGRRPTMGSRIEGLRGYIEFRLARGRGRLHEDLVGSECSS